MIEDSNIRSPSTAALTGPALVCPTPSNVKNDDVANFQMSNWKIESRNPQIQSFLLRGPISIPRRPS